MEGLDKGDLSSGWPLIRMTSQTSFHPLLIICVQQVLNLGCDHVTLKQDMLGFELASWTLLSVLVLLLLFWEVGWVRA